MGICFPKQKEVKEPVAQDPEKQGETIQGEEQAEVPVQRERPKEPTTQMEFPREALQAVAVVEPEGGQQQEEAPAKDLEEEEEEAKLEDAARSVGEEQAEIAAENPEEGHADVRKSLVKQPLQAPVSSMEQAERIAQRPSSGEAAAVLHESEGLPFDKAPEIKEAPEVAAPAAEEQPEKEPFKIPENLEDYEVQHSEYYPKFRERWNAAVQQAKGKGKKIEDEQLNQWKRRDLMDPNIKEVEKYVNKQDGYVYSGYMLKNQLIGPGSKLLRGGQIQHDGIFKNNKMVGEGYMITYDPEGNIQTIFVTKDEVPSGIMQAAVKSPKPRASSGLELRGAGTGEHHAANESHEEGRKSVPSQEKASHEVIEQPQQQPITH